MYQSVFRTALFAGQVVVVTGGGSGIGRCVAHELASLGATVALVGRNQDKLEAVQAELQQAAVPEARVSRHSADIRDEAAVKALVAEVLARHGRIDALVNNAGGQYIAPLASIGAKGWQAVLDTNLTGGFLMARECFVQHMAEHGGSIVNMVADMWGSMPGMGHSGAARAGMVSLTETAAAEWAPHGVRVNAIAPGYIASSGMDHYPPEAAAMLRKMPATVPAGRFGNEAEVSAAIVFLLSPAASFISGTVLRVDGARPQVRMGMGPVAASAEVQQRQAVRAFDGFALYQTPKVFQS
ncbi:SDR family oxidoreductase [Comamonas resistens]|uniref:Peroxisomal trans-2-enoyl-CoA reductase n=1 Tax=Comamonas resistens TaxID=3046670 RepID=A0ABY8SWK8_9BURK|nr:SDR family oxidoreductase [Comamonas resistens]MDL5038005.1 SDR family oxidoreductase [Comamonas resistens]WHS67308.1 SDR family oxidoreductase [Comamonas resistens]